MSSIPAFVSRSLLLTTVAALLSLAGVAHAQEAPAEARAAEAASDSDGQPLVERASANPSGFVFGETMYFERMGNGGLCGNYDDDDDAARRVGPGGAHYGHITVRRLMADETVCDDLAACGAETFDTDGDGLCDAVDVCSITAECFAGDEASVAR